MNTSPPLILASTSRYRRTLLERLQVPFHTASPEVDETPLDAESPTARAARLAAAKARAVAGAPGTALAAVIIGSDQVASLDGHVLRKPGSVERARIQLASLSGRRARFDTAVAILDCRHGSLNQHLDTTLVQFRTLDAATIDRYLRAENALDCAGGFKAEGLGIALMQQIESTDPTAIVGLPLIWTADALRDAGFLLP